MLTRSRTAIVAVSLMLLPLATGCGHYEFDLSRPTELAGHIGTKTDLIITRDPLEYRLIAVESRLVMRVYNGTDDPVELLGAQSSVVDARGQSHPFRGQSIASHSFIKLILPPLRARIERTGPSIGFGIGIGRAGRHRALSDPFLDDQEPQYFDVVDDDALYWDWDGETQVRVLLNYAGGDKRFTHEFVFQRRKE